MHLSTWANERTRPAHPLVLAPVVAETSKRTTTRMREKVKHKVAEAHKKQKKHAKHDPTWKSSALTRSPLVLSHQLMGNSHSHARREAKGARHPQQLPLQGPGHRRAAGGKGQGALASPRLVTRRERR